MRFSLIDRVTEHEPGVRLKAVKLVTSAEEYLADHFPTFPVLPGVMMLEALAQAGRRLAAEAPEEPATGPLVVEEVRNVRYAAFVQPGQALEVEVTLKKRDGQAWSMQGVGTVEGKTAVQARFTLAPVPAPRNPTGTPPESPPELPPDTPPDSSPASSPASPTSST